MRPVLPACVEEVGFSLCVWVWPCLASSSEDAGLQRLRGSALGGRGGGARRLALGRRRTSGGCAGTSCGATEEGSALLRETLELTQQAGSCLPQTITARSYHPHMIISTLPHPDHKMPSSYCTLFL